MEKYLGEQIPKLGFGLMRLPMKDDVIDIEQTKEMVDLFLEKGFCYFDTAYGYGDGSSERAMKEALIDRHPRESFLVATKLPAWAGAKNQQEVEQMFYTSLERTGAGYFDYYLLHNLGEGRTHYFDDYDIWSFLAKKKEEGLIRHLGFSFHDKAALLDEILTAHPEMEFVQLQINYADWENPAVESRKCYETACRHGKPVIIMEPVKGGNLADPPGQIKEIFQSVTPGASPASWGIRFGASLDHIITVLSGMSSMEQMQDNLSFMGNFHPLSAEEHKAIAKAGEILASIPTVPCTSCAYCMKECPKSIAIYGTFTAMNNYRLYNNLAASRGSYFWNSDSQGRGRASQCIQCGRCEEVCPQHIDIREELKKASQLFES